MNSSVNTLPPVGLAQGGMDLADDTPSPEREEGESSGQPWRMPIECRESHAVLVRSRIRVLAPVLVVATLAWIPVDLAWLGAPLLRHSIPVRLVIALAMLIVFRLAPRMSALAAVHAFLWPQAIGFGALQLLVDPTNDSALEIGYGLFPFVLAAQLATLPMSWRHGLMAATAPAVPFLAALHVGGLHGPSVWNAAWLLALLVLIAIWTSHAQLRMLVDLLGARSDAAHDALTGLPNRRTATRRLDVERQRALRTGEPLSVLMLDLDHFKRVNDAWGHEAGDRVLVAVAQVLRQELRGMDLAARHGGEEFLAILPEATECAAMQVAERVRERIARLRVDVGGGTAMPTISIGVATLAPGESAEDLVASADAALYAAKKAGRNRCVARGARIAPAAGERITT